jgi:Domain of unknown function (DUF4845)
MTFTHRPRRERGLSLIGLLLFGIVAVMLVVVGMRVLPTALEYIAIKRAITRVATSGETGTVEIQKAFDRIAAVDDIATLTGKDLLITRNGSQVTIAFRYEKRIPLFGPASLLLDYEGSTAAK